MIPVLVAAALLLVLADRRTRRAIKLAWLFSTGEPMDGRARTDAGWRRPATKALTPTGHAARWYHLRREIRTGVRLGLVLGGLGVAYGLIAAETLTVLVLELAAAGLVAASSSLGARAALTVQSGRVWVRPAHLGLGLVGGVAYRGALEWSHTRRRVRPLHLALGDMIGVPRAVRPKSWIEIPRDYATRAGAKITVRLPQGFALTAEVTRQLIADATCAVLGLENVSHKWHLAGNHPRVVFTVHAPPPDQVRLADVRALLPKLGPAELLLGLGRQAAPVIWQQEADSPHACLSMGSGAGKSATARALVAQHLARGGIVLILDIKRLSHAYARGLAGVRYCRSIAEIHDALLWLSDELDRRNEAADDGADDDGNTDHVEIGPRILVVAEELNATAARLAKHWQAIKSKDDPKQSPAVDALAACLFMGRQVRVNVVCIAQFLSARLLGGGEARENLGFRVLGRFTMNNWRALCSEVWPPPRSSRHRGRVQVFVSGDVRECQVLFLTPAEARELATSGTVTPFPASGPATSPVVHLHSVGGDAEPIGLRQAVAEGIVPGNLEALRKARTRDRGDFPAHVAEGEGGELLYLRGDLARWARNRPRAGVA
jgi:hypothetical protein